MQILKYIADKMRRVGSNNKGPRIYLDDQDIAKAGFTAGQMYDIQLKDETLSLFVKPDGARIVTGKMKGGRSVPVIDINSAKFLSVFAGYDSIRVIIADGAIHILPLPEDVKTKQSLDFLNDTLGKGEPLLIGSLAFGGGILDHAVETGLAESGIESELAFACEIREELLDHAAAENDVWKKNTIAIAAPIQKVAFDDWLMSRLPKVHGMVMGIPCSGASVAGRAKMKTPVPEAHPEVGHLIVGTLAIIAKVNPAFVLFENVHQYRESASGYIFRQQMADLGYNIFEAEIRGEEFNCLEHRVRWCAVAVRKGIPFDFEQLETPERITRAIGDILEDIPLDDPSWSEMPGLKAKEIRDRENGKSFAMQVISEESTKSPTMTKGMARNRSTDPKIAHPENPNLLRVPTPIEHARVKGIPEHLIKGLCKTTAHEVLGQSVLYAPFKAVGKLIGEYLQRYSLGERGTCAPRLARAAG